MWSQDSGPVLPTTRPIVGRGGIEGLVLATGHFRNGILLAPLTAKAIVEVLSGNDVPSEIWRVADPARFAKVAS